MFHYLRYALSTLFFVVAMSAFAPANNPFTTAEQQQISIETPGLFARSNAFSIDFSILNDKEFSFPLPVGKAKLVNNAQLDITTNQGDVVKAMFSGTVRLSRKLDGYGNVVVVRHGNGLETVYGNNAQNLVKVGQSVKAGQTIAIVGADGKLTFAIMVNGGRINPETILGVKSHKLRRQTLLCDILKAAQARAFEKKIEELALRKDDLELWNKVDRFWQNKNKKAYEKSVGSHNATDIGGARAFVPTGVDMSGGKRNGDLEIKWSEREERLKKHTEELNRINKTIDRITNKVAKIKATEIRMENPKIDDPKKEKKEKAGKEVDYDKMQREQSEAERNLENAVAQSRIDAMQEGYEKEKK